MLPQCGEDSVSIGLCADHAGIRPATAQPAGLCGSRHRRPGSTACRPYVSVQLASLDNATDEELVGASVKYANGRDNNWWAEPSGTRHLRVHGTRTPLVHDSLDGPPECKSWSRDGASGLRESTLARC